MLLLTEARAERKAKGYLRPWPCSGIFMAFPGFSYGFLPLLLPRRYNGLQYYKAALYAAWWYSVVSIRKSAIVEQLMGWEGEESTQFLYEK